MKLPKELTDKPCWLLWKSIDGKKIPYYVNGRPRGETGTQEDRDNLAPFERALAKVDGYDGLGFAIFPEHGLIGLDFDHCIDMGIVNPEVSTMLSGTYHEVSPSGEGVRAFMRGDLDGVVGARPLNGHAYGFEAYNTERFLTVTGNALGGFKIGPLNEAVMKLIKTRQRKTEADAVPLGYSLEEVQNILGAVDPSRRRTEGWLDCVFGVHHETGGSEEGFEIVDAWSARATNYCGRDALRAIWDKASGGEVTFKSVEYYAREAGWRPSLEMQVADLPKVENEELPGFERTKKGQIINTAGNVALAMRSRSCTGFDLAFDTFRDEVVVREGETWRPIRDADNFNVRCRLEEIGFKTPPKELVRDAIVSVSEEQAIDSAIEWLRGCQWDGRGRVDGFLRDYFGAADTPYVRAVSRYLWTALAGRVLVPGVKADSVPILEGAQGVGKSSGIAAMAPGPELFTEISFHEKPDELSRKMRGKVLAEIAELAGLHTRELEQIKKFITSTHEEWTPKYREYKTMFARRLVFMGSTNETEILADFTGNRRWLPVHVGRVDVRAIERDRRLLWAEARALFEAHGVLYAEAVDLAADAHEAYTMTDPWEEKIRGWLESESMGGVPNWSEPFKTQDVVDALRLTSVQDTMYNRKRIRKVLVMAGFEYRVMWGAGKTEKRWCATEKCDFSQT